MTPPQLLDLTNFFQCDQLWEEMPLCEKGRICESCNKVLIDFRELSDKEVADIHKDPTQTVCGIYKKRQLSIANQQAHVRPSVSNWKMIGIGLAGILFSQNATSQQLAEPTEINQTTHQTKPLEKKASNFPEDRVVIHGKVTDAETNEELIGASIYIKNHKLSTSTDFIGNYSLDITEVFDSLSQVVIIYEYIGYANKEVIFSRNGDRELNVGMLYPEGGVDLDEIYVTGFSVPLGPPPSFLQRVKTKIWHLLKSKVE